VVTDVVKASNPAGRSIPECGLWWTGWIGGNLALPIASAILASTGGRGGAGVLGSFLLLTALFYALAAFSFRRIAVTVARWQDDRIALAS
jgi:O-antigen ligase